MLFLILFLYSPLSPLLLVQDMVYLAVPHTETIPSLCSILATFLCNFLVLYTLLELQRTEQHMVFKT